MGRKSTEESLKIKALAKRHGYTERWARKQREKNTALWQEFCSEVVVELPEARIEEKPEERERTIERVAESDLERAERVCEEAWRALAGVNAILAGALADEEKQDIVPALSKASREARRQWEDAVKHRDVLRRAEGLWLPVERVREIRAHMKPLGGLIEKLEVNIAGRLRPENRHEFYRAFESVVPEWNRMVMEVDKSIERLIPTC